MIELKLIFEELKSLTGRIKSLEERTTDTKNAIKEIRKRSINTEKSDFQHYLSAMDNLKDATYTLLAESTENLFSVSPNELEKNKYPEMVMNDFQEGRRALINALYHLDQCILRLELC